MKPKIKIAADILMTLTLLLLMAYHPNPFLNYGKIHSLKRVAP